MLASYRSKGWYQRWRVGLLFLYALLVLTYGAAFAYAGRPLLMLFLTPAVLLAIIIIAVLPITDRPPSVFIKPLLLLFLVAITCWPDYLAIALPGLPWITLVRLVAAPLALLFLIDLSSSRPFRVTIKGIFEHNKGITICLLGVLLLIILTIPLSSDPGLSINKAIVFLITCLIPFFCAAYIFSISRSTEFLPKLFLFVSIFVCLIAVQEVRHSQVPWAGNIPSFLVVQDEAVQRILVGGMRAGTGLYRAQSRFTTSLGLGEFLGISLPFILHLLFGVGSKPVRFVSLLSLPLIFYVVLATDSRLAAIGMFASCLMYLLAWATVRWRSDERSLFGPAISIGYPAVFVLFMVATFYVGRLRGLVWGDGSQDASNEARKQMYRDGIPMVLNNPIGNGWGMGAQKLGFTNGAGVLTIDTYYLAVALEIGVMGFIFYYGLLLIAIFKGASSLLKPLSRDNKILIPITIALVNFVISKSVFSNLENHPIIFILVGIVAAVMFRRKMEGSVT